MPGKIFVAPIRTFFVMMANGFPAAATSWDCLFTADAARSWRVLLLLVANRPFNRFVDVVSLHIHSAPSSGISAG